MNIEINRRITWIGIFLLSFCPLVVAQTESDRYPFIRNNKVGFIDGQGHEVIPPQFGNAGISQFRDGLINVGASGGWSYVDESGKFFFEQKFWWAYPFSEGLACVQLPGRGAGYGFIDKTGRLLIQGLSANSEFHNGLAPIKLGDKWGYLGTDMKMAIPAKFDSAGRFSEGMAEIGIGKKVGYIDRSGTIIVQPKYDLTMPFMDGMGRVNVFFKRKPLPSGKVGVEGQTTYDVYLWGYVDQRGLEIIPPKFLAVTDFSEDYAFAEPNDETESGPVRFGIIDKSGQFLHEPVFDEVTAFSESLAAVRVGEQWGYVDHAGSWVIPPRFTHADPFWHGLARVVFTKDRRGYIDKSGSVVWQSQSE